jgi:hypothetical protein
MARLIIEHFDRREFADLIAEFKRWQRASGLKLGSPYHLTKRRLTSAQRRWLRDYLRRWEARH